jgi:hypothetical protein
MKSFLSGNRAKYNIFIILVKENEFLLDENNRGIK